ncbi:MAG: spondin domain-containing protein [Planctomycetota bacterium]
MHTLRSCTLAALAVSLSPFAPAQQGFANYELVFEGTWGPATHPVMFPPGPHFSSLIGGLHDAGTVFWEEGQLASPGIKAMAELGLTGPMRNEVFAEISGGGAQSALQFFGLAVSPAMRRERFTVWAEFSHITLVSMLAPSPDWFVGVGGLNLRPGGVWADELEVPLELYDSGTDSGVWYTSPDEVTQPPIPIAKIDTSAGPFQGQGTIVGKFIFRRVSSNLVYGCGVNPDGSMTALSGPPIIGTTVRLGLHDASLSMTTPALTVFAIGLVPDAAFPCGTSVNGLGLAPGSPGELLVAPPFPVLPGPMWNGAPAQLDLVIPGLPRLVGSRVYVQGAISDGTRVGLTDAAELLIGS